ncbi:MAG: permease [Deltaproteobacteria bacterium]|nr:permease [Deltaproteobacteria bacterium]
MINTLKKYKFFIIVGVIDLIWGLLNPSVGLKSLQISADSLGEMFTIVPPVFILLGLFDVWVPRTTIIKLMGEGSGWLGAILAFALGSFSAGPLYAAFPVAGVLLSKGSRFSNVLIFIGAWSTTKVPMLLFEAASLGWRFMFYRLLINIVGILLIGYAVGKMITDQDRRLLYDKVLTLPT